jgi:hypothetical protein
MNDKWMPEIFYEESKDGITRGLPFVNVPKDKDMPSALFLCEIRDIEEEPENEVEKEMTINMYINSRHLKQGLTKEEYNKVRHIIGLESLEESSVKGEEINSVINKNINN